MLPLPLLLLPQVAVPWGTRHHTAFIGTLKGAAVVAGELGGAVSVVLATLALLLFEKDQPPRLWRQLLQLSGTLAAFEALFWAAAVWKVYSGTGAVSDGVHIQGPAGQSGADLEGNGGLTPVAAGSGTPRAAWNSWRLQHAWQRACRHMRFNALAQPPPLGAGWDLEAAVAAHRAGSFHHGQSAPSPVAGIWVVQSCGGCWCIPQELLTAVRGRRL